MTGPRRNTDGSLDIGYHRRRARRLRHLARRRAWGVVRRAVIALCGAMVLGVNRQEGVISS